jgi:hypothetical protein
MLTAVGGTLVGGGIIYSLFVPPGHSRMTTATTKMRALEDEQDEAGTEAGRDEQDACGELDLRRMAQISWAKASDHAGEVRQVARLVGQWPVPRTC